MEENKKLEFVKNLYSKYNVQADEQGLSQASEFFAQDFDVALDSFYKQFNINKTVDPNNLTPLKEKYGFIAPKPVEVKEDRIDTLGEIGTAAVDGVKNAFGAIQAATEVFPMKVERGLRDIGMDGVADAFSFMAANPAAKYRMVTGEQETSSEDQFAKSISKIVGNMSSQKPTQDILEAINEGDIKNITMSALSNAANLIPSVAVGAASGAMTGGNPVAAFAGFGLMMSGQEIASAAEAIAKENGTTVEDIIKNRQESLLVPIVVGTAGAGLEAVGFKMFGKMMKGFMSEEAVKKALSSVPSTTAFEMLSETMQGAASVYSVEHSVTGSHEKAIEASREFLKTEGINTAANTAAGTLTTAGLGALGGSSYNAAKSFLAKRDEAKGIKPEQKTEIKEAKAEAKTQVSNAINSKLSEVSAKVGDISDTELKKSLDELLGKFTEARSEKASEKVVPEKEAEISKKNAESKKSKENEAKVTEKNKEAVAKGKPEKQKEVVKAKYTVGDSVTYEGNTYTIDITDKVPDGRDVYALVDEQGNQLKNESGIRIYTDGNSLENASKPEKVEGGSKADVKDTNIEEKVSRIKDKATLKSAIYSFYSYSKTDVSQVEEVNAMADVTDAIATNRAKKFGISKEEWYKSRIAGTSSTKSNDPNAPRAQVRFLEDGRAVLSSIRQPDTTSFLHEFSHVLRRDLDDIETNALNEEFGLAIDGRWDVKSEERFASAFERYVADGQLPKGLSEKNQGAIKKAFDKLSEWFKDIHESIKGVYSVEEMSPKLRSVMDAIVEGKPLVLPETGLKRSAVDIEDVSFEDVENEQLDTEESSPEEIQEVEEVQEVQNIEELDLIETQEEIDEQTTEETNREDSKVDGNTNEGKGTVVEKDRLTTAKGKIDKIRARATRLAEKYAELGKLDSKERSSIDKTDFDIDDIAKEFGLKEGEFSKEIAELKKIFADLKEEIKLDNEIKTEIETRLKGTGISADEISDIAKELGEEWSFISVKEKDKVVKGIVEFFNDSMERRIYDKASGEFYDSVEEVPSGPNDNKFDKILNLSKVHKTSKDRNAFLNHLDQIEIKRLNEKQKEQLNKAIKDFVKSSVNNLSTSNLESQTESYKAISRQIKSIINRPDMKGYIDVEEIQASLEKGDVNTSESVEIKESVAVKKKERVKDSEQLSEEKQRASEFRQKEGEFKRRTDNVMYELKAKQLDYFRLEAKLKILTSGEHVTSTEAAIKKVQTLKDVRLAIAKAEKAFREQKLQTVRDLREITKGEIAMYREFGMDSQADQLTGILKDKMRIVEIVRNEMGKTQRVIRSETIGNLALAAKYKEAKQVKAKSGDKEVSYRKILDTLDRRDTEQKTFNLISRINRMNQDLKSIEADVNAEKELAIKEKRKPDFKDKEDQYKRILGHVNNAISEVTENYKSLNNYIPKDFPKLQNGVDNTKKMLEEISGHLRKSDSASVLNQAAAKAKTNQAKSTRSTLLENLKDFVDGKFDTAQEYKNLMLDINNELIAKNITPLSKNEMETILSKTEAGITREIEKILRVEGKRRPNNALKEIIDNLVAPDAVRQEAQAKMNELDAKMNTEGLNDEEHLIRALLPLVGIQSATLAEKKVGLQLAKLAAKSNMAMTNDVHAKAVDARSNRNGEIFIESILGIQPNANGKYDIPTGKNNHKDVDLYSNEKEYKVGDLVYRNGKIYEAANIVSKDTVFSTSNFTPIDSIATPMTKAEYSRVKRSVNIWARAFAKIQEWGLVLDGLESFVDKLASKDRVNNAMESKLVKKVSKDFRGAYNDSSKNISSDIDKFLKGVSKATGLTSTKAIYEKLAQMRNETVIIEFTTPSGRKVSIEKSKGELMNDYVRLDNPDLIPTYEAMKANTAYDVASDKGWSDEKAEAILNAVDDEMRGIAEAAMDVMPDIFERLNKAHRGLYGTDLVREDRYFPIKRYVDSTSSANDMFLIDGGKSSDSMIQAVKNFNTITRRGSRAALKSSDIVEDLFSYIKNANHYAAHVTPVRDLSQLLQEGDYAEYISTMFGKPYRTIGNNLLANVATGSSYGYRDMPPVNLIRKGLILGTLGGNLTLIPKQLSSLAAFAGSMDALRWAGNIATAPVRLMSGELLNNYRAMLNTTFIKDRLQKSNAANPDLVDAALSNIEESIGKYKKKGRFGAELAMNDLTRFLMLPSKIGDIGAILVGGEPLYMSTYKDALKAGKNESEARKLAEDKLAEAVSRTQQSDLIMDRPVLATMGSLQSLLISFMSSPILYGRVVSSSFRDLAFGRGSKKVAIKKLVLFAYVMPALFYMVSSGSIGLVTGGDEDDERYNDSNPIARNTFVAMMGMVQHLPVIYPLVHYFMDRVFYGNKFRASAIPAISRIEKGVERLGTVVTKMVDDGELTQESLLPFIQEAAQISGLNVGAVERMAVNWSEMGNTLESEAFITNVFLGLGYSKEALGLSKYGDTPKKSTRAVKTKRTLRKRNKLRDKL